MLSSGLSSEDEDEEQPGEWRLEPYEPPWHDNGLRRGVFWTPRARIFPRSSLLGAGLAGFWEFGRGGSTG
jgi:hypothetical protein